MGGSMKVGPGIGGELSRGRLHRSRDAHPPCDPRCDPDPVGSKARAGRGPSYLPTAFGQLDQLTRPPTSLYVMLGSRRPIAVRSEEQTSELQSLMRITYDVLCLKKKRKEYQLVYCNKL